MKHCLKSRLSRPVAARANSVVLGLLLASVVANPAHAALDMFINLGDKIKGESKDKLQGPKGDVDVLSWAWGMSNDGTTHRAGGGGAGKSTFKDITFRKYVDTASSALMTALAKGSHLDEVRLLVRKAGDTPQKHIHITMKEVLVTSINIGGSGGEDRLVETVTLNFAQVQFDYTTQDSKGTVTGDKTFVWNIAGNTAAASPSPVAQAGGEGTIATAESLSATGSEQLKDLLHAGTTESLKAHEEIRSGKHYLAVEIARSKDEQAGRVVAQTSSDLQTWSAGAVIEEIVEDSPARQVIRYLIPMDQARQFLRVSPQ